MQSINKTFFPKSSYILIVSIILYYWNVIFYAEVNLKFMVALSLLMIIIGRIFFVFFNKNKKNTEVNLNYSKVFAGGLLLTLIGLTAHLFFYGTININNYVENYSATRGKGYITVFFDFLPLGLLLMLHSVVKNKKKSLVLIILAALSIYCGFYFFELLKRRQLVLVILGILAILGDKANFKNKFLMYGGGILLYIFFTVFARVRMIVQDASLTQAYDYVAVNFVFDWISPSNFEGKYTSRILGDVVDYVNLNGVEPSILFGVISSIIPRSLFDSKFLGFPEWYASTFHLNDYMSGSGFAGSLIGESYLIFSWAGIILVFFTVGYISKKIDLLNRTEFKVMYAAIIYIITFLPRYDLASIFIFILFMYLPTYLVYFLSIIRGVKK